MTRFAKRGLGYFCTFFSVNGRAKVHTMRRDGRSVGKVVGDGGVTINTLHSG